MAEKYPPPSPLFDTLDNLQHSPALPPALQTPPSESTAREYALARDFLLSYAGSEDTFNAYRRELERHASWMWWVHNCNFKNTDRATFTAYLDFIQRPPKHWVGDKHCPRFIDRDGLRTPNPQWRPFVLRARKADIKIGANPKPQQHQLTPKSMQAVFACLSSFYQFLIAENYSQINPVTLIRQKSRYLQKQQQPKQTRRLSDKQWETVIDCIEKQLPNNPQMERSYFMLQCFFLLGCRISELAVTATHTPTMGDFAPDKQARWWFSTVGKGNKRRDIAVCDSLLAGLKRYRTHLGLSPLPGRGEQTPIIGKVRGNGGLSARQIRNLVQACFDHAIYRLQHQNLTDEATDLAHATVHWLRHTAISIDVSNRPREDVRDDAGHSAASTTEQYIDTERAARHASARHKQLVPHSQHSDSAQINSAEE